VIDKRNTRNEKNAQTQRKRNTAADMDETRADGDDDDEGGNSEDEYGEYEDGSGSAVQTETGSQFLLHNRSSEEDAVQGGR
jgi:hypothetical protein